MSSRPNQGRPPDHSSIRTLSVRTFFRCDFAAITNAASTQAAHRAGSHDLETCVGCTAFACVIRGARRSTVGQAFTGVVAGCMSSRESASTCRVLRFRNSCVSMSDVWCLEALCWVYELQMCRRPLLRQQSLENPFKELMNCVSTPSTADCV